LVLVADSALFNKENIRLLEEQKQPYIVAAQLKKLPQDTQKILFDRSSFERLSDDESFIETIYQGQRLIVTYSAKRAKKDAHDRKKAVEKAHKLYHNKTVKSAVKGHHARYLNVQGDGRLELDENRIAQAARWDGLHGVITNMKELSAQEAISHYHGLWQVEETFRLSKHDLSIRPIFHWT
jgi:transposase